MLNINWIEISPSVEFRDRS